MKKRITDIEIDEETPSHRILFLDGVHFDSVDAACIPQFGLRIGLEIEAEVLQKLIEAYEGMQAKNYALELLSNQSYSRSQMTGQLRQKGFAPQAIDITLEDLEQLGHIKDEKFAKKWVNRRRRSKPKGKKMLQHELVNMNVDKTTADRVLAWDQRSRGSKRRNAIGTETDKALPIAPTTSCETPATRFSTAAWIRL